MDIKQQSACLVVNPIKAYTYGFLCSKRDIRNEFHSLFVCDHFISDRKKLSSSYFYKSPNIIIFFSKYQEACKVIKFCRNYDE